MIKLLNVMSGSMEIKYDVKVVTDCESLNVDMINEAEIFMPLTTKNERLNSEIRKRVWNLALLKRKCLSLRLHNIVWGMERGK